MKTILEFSYSLTDNYGLSIIILSIIVNIILLPLYYMAEKWKAKDKALQDSMKPEIDNIKKHYKGQERHFYIQTIYRRYGYHPLSSIKASIGFLIQIPFFLAAFHLLSNYQALNGVSFGILKDLGAPDHLIEGFNVLPIVMTIVNLLSAYIYIELLNKSEKIQLFALAFIFLVVLYDEPAGLLLYWTMNNVFSLMKNIVEKKFKLGPLFSRRFKSREPSFEFLAKLPYFKILFLLVLAYAYFEGIALIASDGITSKFAIKMQKLLSNFFISTSIIFLIVISFKSSIVTYIFKIKILPVSKNENGDFIFLLFPMMPIVQYVILNQDILLPLDTAYVIVAALMVSMLLIISIPILLSAVIPKYLTVPLGLALAFVVFYMPTLALENTWHKEGDFKIQLLLFAAIFLVSLFLYLKKKKILQILILILFLLNTLHIIFLSHYNGKNNTENTEAKSALYFANKMKDRHISKKPNIYLLTYDAYVINETMRQYGIDNSAQELFLEENGFKIYRKAYSVAGNTISSMGRLLNMSIKPPGNAIGGKGLVYRVLKNLGYKVGVIDFDGYLFQNRIPDLDYFYPKNIQNGYKIITKSILEGEFRSDAQKTFTKVTYEDFIAEKRKYMKQTSVPKFLYTHTVPGHSQNSGKCLPCEKKEFARRLHLMANIEMREDIETITKNDPDSIIIVNGDHGPKLTGNCRELNNYKKKEEVSRLDVQDRFGAFLAIRWPKGYRAYDDNLTVIQNIFPAIFATLYKDKKLFSFLRMKRVTANDQTHRTSGVLVDNGIIRGGLNDGEPLFPDTNVTNCSVESKRGKDQ